MHWLENHAIFAPIIAQLVQPSPELEYLRGAVDAAVNGTNSPETQHYSARTIEGHAASCALVVKEIAALADTAQRSQNSGLQVLACFLRPGARLYKTEECLEVLRDVALDGLFEYLDEQLASRNAVFGLLNKYKQRCEWFRRVQLRALADGVAGGVRGERALASDLHEYLLDQGVDFTIEPTSGSGEVDLLLRDSDGRYTIIDAKYLDTSAAISTIRTKLSSGFHQVHRYCEDYNEPSGFLVPFTIGSKKLTLDLEESDGLKYLSVGSKRIYYMEIAIADAPTASAAGRAAEVTLSSADLKTIFAETENGA